MSGIIMEVCAASLADALAAAENGADRIELNSALPLGGLTPSTALLRQIRRHTRLPVICMVRPRGGGFACSEQEFELMLEQAAELLENGAAGIAFGFLHEDRTLDCARTAQMCALIHTYGRTAVFHRAFDLLEQPVSSALQLAQLGVDRILTSGLAPSALQGIEVLRALEEQAGSQVEILAGCGITPDNVSKLIRQTGIRQIHASCSGQTDDPAAMANGVDFSESGRCSRQCADPDIVQALAGRIRVLEEESAGAGR